MLLHTSVLLFQILFQIPGNLIGCRISRDKSACAMCNDVIAWKYIYI